MTIESNVRSLSSILAELILMRAREAREVLSWWKTHFACASSAACIALVVSPSYANAQDASGPEAGWCYPEPIASWSESTKDFQRESARSLVKDVNAAIARGDKEFTVKAGDYRFGSRDLENFKITADNFTLNAYGATFWFNGKLGVDGFAISKSRNLTLKGATVDYDPLPYTQGRIVGIDQDGKSYDIKIDPGFPLPKEMIKSLPGIASTTSVKAVYFTPDGLCFRMTPMDWISKLEEKGDREYRVKCLNNALFNYDVDQPQVGDPTVLPDRSGRMAFALRDCERVTLEDVTVYAAPNMGFSEVFGKGGDIYRACKILRRPCTKRLIACNADAFHSMAVCHGPTIENCEFSYACDDFVNIHGVFGMAIRQPSPSELIISQEYIDQSNFAGKPLRFISWDDERLLGEATAVSCEKIEDESLRAEALSAPAALKKMDQGFRLREFDAKHLALLKLKLDRPIAAPKFTLVESQTASGSGSVIRNSYFHHGVARGVLLKGSNAIFAQNKVEHTCLNGLLLATDRLFFESSCPSKMLIKDNVFADCCRSPESQMWFNGFHATIAVWNDGRRQAFSRKGTHECSDIAIEGNKILRSPNAAIFMANTLRGSIKGNEIIGSGWASPLNQSDKEMADNDYAIFLTCSESVKISGNVLESPGKFCKGPVGLGANLKDCEAKGNAMTEGKAQGK